MSGAGLPNLDASPLPLQVTNPDGTISTYQFQSGRALALTDSQGNSAPRQVAVLVGGGTAPKLPDGSGVLAVVELALNANDAQHPLQPVGSI